MDASREIEMGSIGKREKKMSQSQCQVESWAGGTLPCGNGDKGEQGEW